MSDEDSAALRETIARVDERTKYIVEALPNFVTKDEFSPVKAIAFGLVGLVCITVLGALIAAVVR